MVSDWTFYEVTGHGFTGELEGRSLFAFTTMPETWKDNGEVMVGEYYLSLDHAMVAAVAEKHTGKRGAGGTGVGTAADWFMRMIGAGQLQEAGPDGGRALHEALKESDQSAHKIERALETKGYVIARQAIG
jgi:hypothetical protein